MSSKLSPLLVRVFIKSLYSSELGLTCEFIPKIAEKLLISHGLIDTSQCLMIVIGIV
ncbi:hypothetical protein D3C80_888100 [compost metagenome]